MKKSYKTHLSKEECIKRFKNQELYKKVRYYRVWTLNEDMFGNLTISTKNISPFSVFIWPFKYCYMRVICSIFETDETTIHISTKLQKTDLFLIILLFLNVGSWLSLTFDYFLFILLVIYAIIYYLVAAFKKNNELEIIDFLKGLFELEEA